MKQMQKVAFRDKWGRWRESKGFYFTPALFGGNRRRERTLISQQGSSYFSI